MDARALTKIISPVADGSRAALRMVDIAQGLTERDPSVARSTVGERRTAARIYKWLRQSGLRAGANQRQAEIMSWLPKKTRECTDERIAQTQKSSIEAVRSYERMLRSLKNLEEALDTKTKVNGHHHCSSGSTKL